MCFYAFYSSFWGMMTPQSAFKEIFIQVIQARNLFQKPYHSVEKIHEHLLHLWLATNLLWHEGFYVAQYLFKLIAYSNYINTLKKLPWYWQKFPLRSLRLNWPLHWNTMSQARLFARETSIGNLNWSRSNVCVCPYIFCKQITNITREIFSEVMHLHQARESWKISENHILKRKDY